uniref:Uncharacterized protein n=1 Tax=Ciona intestinalis TaxID=7719 RepID=H2XWP2_CIOIN
MVPSDRITPLHLEYMTERSCFNYISGNQIFNRTFHYIQVYCIVDLCLHVFPII